MIEEIAPRQFIPGDILAEDVFSKSGNLLVGEGTTLNEILISKLVDFGIEHIQVLRQPQNLYGESKTKQTVVKKYEEGLLLVKELMGHLSSGGKLSYEHVETLTTLLIHQFKEVDVVVKFMLELKNADEYTYTHSLNVAFYSMMIGKWLGLTENEVQRIVQSALLHDIGKMKIPDEILNKQGKLTFEEFEVIKQHPIYGYEILKEVEGIDSHIKEGVLSHHERMNGSGYPYQASPDHLGLFPRIIAVADVFDAMISNRVYKSKVTPFDAFEMFQTVGYAQFDLTVLNAFLRHMPNYLVGAQVKLSNGKVGHIAYIPPHEVTKPIVTVESEIIDLAYNNTIAILEMV